MEISEIESRLRIYSPEFTVLFKNKGCVFGGFLRDYIAGYPPNDVDVCVSHLYWEQYCEDMIELGYNIDFQTKDVYILSKEKELKIEVLVVEDDPAFSLLGPCPDPDFDINLPKIEPNNFNSRARTIIQIT